MKKSIIIFAALLLVIGTALFFINTGNQHEKTAEDATKKLLNAFNLDDTEVIKNHLSQRIKDIANIDEQIKVLTNIIKDDISDYRVDVETMGGEKDGNDWVELRVSAKVEKINSSDNIETIIIAFQLHNKNTSLDESVEMILIQYKDGREVCFRPLKHDISLDLDGDGFSNEEENVNGTPIDVPNWQAG